MDNLVKVDEQKVGGITKEAFNLPIPDNELANLIDSRIKETEVFLKDKLDLEARREENEKFWRGIHFDEKKFQEYQIPYKDNIIWQNEETRLSIITSRLPNIIIIPAEDTAEKRENAKKIESFLNIKLNEDFLRRIIKDGLRFRDLYFTACIKCRWDKSLDDFVFELIRPQKIIFDHTATISHDGFTADNMEFICEWIEAPAALFLQTFSDKKEEILKELGWKRGTSKLINSKVRYQEVWFSFYGLDGKLYEGVCWKLNKLILRKELNPYYDWEGYERIKDDNKEKVYRNHFERPRKPYIFFTYQNLGISPIDDTTHIEQSIPLQMVVNKRGRQITEIADRTIPKLIFSGDALTKEDVRNISNDPEQHIRLNENVTDVRAAVTSFQAQAPSPILYQDLLINRTQIDAKFATHSTTRGERVAAESGISRQIVREGDLAVHDDMNKIVVERVIFEMASWAIQMMKLFYEKEHFVKYKGKDGEIIYVELKRDLVDDGLAVNVQASSVDKSQRRFDAQVAAARRQIDPLTYWEDLDAPNPKERTRRLIAFLSGQFGLYSQITNLTSNQNQDLGYKEAQVDIERLKRGEEVEIHKVTPAYLMAMIDYVNSDDYTKQPAKVKKHFQSFVKKLKEKVEEEDTIQTPSIPDLSSPLQGSPAQPSVTPVTSAALPTDLEV